MKSMKYHNFRLNNTPTPKFCSPSSKMKLKILEKENKILTHFCRNHGCTYYMKQAL